MDGAVHFLQICTTKDVISVGSSYLQMIDPIPELLSAPVLYVTVSVLTGSVQTDKQHVHKFYSSTKLLTHQCNIRLLPTMTFCQALWYFVHYVI